MKRKTLAALLLSLSVLLTGCAAGQAAQPQEEAQSGTRDSVVIAIGSEPETLDPTQGWGHGNAPIVQSTLVQYTADLTFENDLATDYTLSEDGLVWTFHIRDDAYFTDGEKLTAEDVAFTLETAKAAQGSVDLTYMDKAEAVDEDTVVITLKQPTSIFLNTLASVGIVPEHAYSDDYGRNPIGSGPYKLVEWRPQEQLIFTANENYYGEQPAIENVTVVFMSEDAALAAVQAGQVDVAYATATLGTTEVPGYHVEAIRRRTTGALPCRCCRTPGRPPTPARPSATMSPVIWRSGRPSPTPSTGTPLWTRCSTALAVRPTPRMTGCPGTTPPWPWRPTWTTPKSFWPVAAGPTPTATALWKRTASRRNLTASTLPATRSGRP